MHTHKISIMPLSLTHTYTQHKSCTQQSLINIHASYPHSHCHTHKTNHSHSIHSSAVTLATFTHTITHTQHSLVHSHACYAYAHSYTYNTTHSYNIHSSTVMLVALTHTLRRTNQTHAIQKTNTRQYVIPHKSKPDKNTCCR